MAELDKIIGEINAQSQEVIDEILAKSRKEAARIMSEAENEAKESCDKLMHDKEVRLSDQLSRATSAAALAKRQLLLAEKQHLIGDVLEQAHLKLTQLPENEYFDLILQLVRKSVLPQKGEIVFNAKDKERLPSDFATLLNQAASEKGGSLQISDQSCPIDGGFILTYNGIEENCSFNALFETNIEILQDQIQRLLFL